MASVDGLTEWIDLGQNLYIGWAGVGGGGEAWWVGLEDVAAGWRADPVLDLLCIPVYAHFLISEFLFLFYQYDTI